MASDVTTICNLALGKIGSERIMALTDQSQPARFCSLFYAQTRDELLREHAWNFATARATLSALSAAPEFGWRFQFALPADCLRVLQLNGYEELQSRDMFDLEGGNLLTDQASAEIRYVRREEDANKYDPLFIEALSTKLASKICVPLTGSRSQADTLYKEYDGIIEGIATSTDSKEGRSKRKPAWVESDLVNARFGGGL